MMWTCQVGKHFFLAHIRLQQLVVWLWSLYPMIKVHKAASPFCQNVVLWCSQAFLSEIRSSERVALWATPLHCQYHDQDFNPVSDPVAIVSLQPESF